MADGISYQRARAFRRALTPPEARLWRYLKGDQLGGLGFRKQHPIGPYILDFYCAAAKLAVEVDGATHDQPIQIAHDARRTAWLSGKGIRVIRIRAKDVRDTLDGVLAYIRREAEAQINPSL
ncbi:endonuclease domain-containing protein [Brevundimonas sp.]|uniref:endonuclease domain-containing protein n=1 Tax=Brevundimonas sp. TaxID=1871086 RepID=UPI00286AB33F|nr:endonuclease domain-containing protein [Brevundimonas sp.]